MRSISSRVTRFLWTNVWQLMVGAYRPSTSTRTLPSLPKLSTSLTERCVSLFLSLLLSVLIFFSAHSHCHCLPQAREAVEMRAQVEKKMAQKEKEKKEEKLRELAQMARDRRAGIKSHGDKGERSSACLLKSLRVITFAPFLFCHHISTDVLFHVSLNSPSPVPPSLLFPSVCIHLGRQVVVAAAATTATSESATRSATTDGKSDSTTGTFLGPLLIRGAGHATLNTPHVNSASVSIHKHTHTDNQTSTRRFPMWRRHSVFVCAPRVRPL